MLKIFNKLHIRQSITLVFGYNCDVTLIKESNKNLNYIKKKKPAATGFS